MGLYKWKDKLNCEHFEIDEQHKTFFKLAMKLQSVDNFENKNKTIDVVMETIKDFYNHADSHFKAEEELGFIKRYDRSKLLSHKMEHSKFLSKLQNIKISEIRTDPCKNAKELGVYAMDWMENHILEEDFRMLKKI
jgi:hemerythrin